MQGVITILKDTIVPRLLVTGQNGIGQNGTDKKVWTKW